MSRNRRRETQQAVEPAEPLDRDAPWDSIDPEKEQAADVVEQKSVAPRRNMAYPSWLQRTL